MLSKFTKETDLSPLYPSNTSLSSSAFPINMTQTKKSFTHKNNINTKFNSYYSPLNSIELTPEKDDINSNTNDYYNCTKSNKNSMHNIINITDNNIKEDAPLRLCNRLFQTDFIKKSKHPTPKINPNQTPQHKTNSTSLLITPHENHNQFKIQNEIEQNKTECSNSKEHNIFKEKEINCTSHIEIKKEDLVENNEKYVNDNYYTFGKPDSISQRNNICNNIIDVNEQIISDSDTHEGNNNLHEMIQVSSNSINDYSFQQNNNANFHKDSGTRTSGSTFHTTNNSNTTTTKSNNNNFSSSYSQSQPFLLSKQQQQRITHTQNSLSQKTFKINVNTRNFSELKEDNINNHFSTENVNETEENEDIEESEEDKEEENGKQNESINSIKVIENNNYNNKNEILIENNNRNNINNNNCHVNKEHECSIHKIAVITKQEQQPKPINSNTHSHQHKIIPSLSKNIPKNSNSHTNINSLTSQFAISRETTITTPSKPKPPPSFQISKINIELNDNNNFKFHNNKYLNTASSNKQYNSINTEIVDSFITYHKFKSKNGILANLKQQNETELKLLKEKSAFIAKQKEENKKWKKQQTELLTSNNNNNSKSLTKGNIESRIQKLIVNEYKQNSGINFSINKSKCNNYNNNNIKRKKSYKSIFENDDTLDIKPLIMKSSLLKQLEQINNNNNDVHEYKTKKEFYKINKYVTLFPNKSKDKLTNNNIINKQNQEEQQHANHVHCSPITAFPEFKGGCIMPVNSIGNIIETNAFFHNQSYQPN